MLRQISLSVEFDGQSWLVEVGKKVKDATLSFQLHTPTKGLKAVGKPGIAIHRMQQLFAYHYSKERFRSKRCDNHSS